ncbi:GAF domain-containing protein [Halosimplex sp. TS25]|uniref:GAF domain-containing protein n=1 Tax=Halosimplex rarum TaxID=3396619 RepID=UPI0039ED3EB3
MPHTICIADRREALSYFERLCGLLLAPDLDMGTTLERLFATETDEFGLDYAFLSRIDRETDRLTFEVVHGSADSFGRSVSVPLACTYCRNTIADSSGTMVVSDALAEGWREDPAYDRFGFRSYVGTTVTVEGELYGTLCFADTEPREEPIADEEVTLVELFGRWVTYELNQWTGPPTHRTVSRNLGGPVRLDSRQLDSVVDALAERPRRLVLLALLDDTAGTGGLDVRRTLDCDASTVALQHVHFPKLDQAGYVEWDREANRLSRGPAFHHIEPFLRLLEEYTAECSQ